MRKLLTVLSALVLAQAANAENNLTTSAEFRTRVQNDMDTTGNADNGVTQNTWEHRLKLGLDFNAGEKLSAHFTLLHNTIWGQELSVGPTGDSNRGERDGVGDDQNMLLVQEAYGTWMLSDSTSFRIGRGGFTLADGSVVSINEWERNPYAFDGLMFTHDMEFGRVSAFFVKFSDFNAALGSVDDPEVNAYGLSLDIKAVPDVIKVLNLHAIQVNRDELTSVDHDNDATTAAIAIAGESVLRYGLTVAGEVAGVDFGVNYALVGGENLNEKAGGTNQDIKSSMYDVKVGYTLASVMNMRFGLDYHSDTGQSAGSTDDETYDSFYYDKHNNAGRMDIFGWGNLTYVGVNWSMMPMDNMKVGVDYYMFSQTEEAGGIVAGNNGGSFTCATGCDNAATESDLGAEIDLWASHKYDNGLTMTGRYSMFTPGAEYESATAALTKEDAYSMIFLEAKMDF